jgi:hypothetical protein
MVSVVFFKTYFTGKWLSLYLNSFWEKTEIKQNNPNKKAVFFIINCFTNKAQENLSFKFIINNID